MYTVAGKMVGCNRNVHKVVTCKIWERQKKHGVMTSGKATFGGRCDRTVNKRGEVYLYRVRLYLYRVRDAMCVRRQGSAVHRLKCL